MDEEDIDYEINAGELPDEILPIWIKMSDKQRRFAAIYARTGNASQSYRMLKESQGLAISTVRGQGHAMAKNENVQICVNAIKEIERKRIIQAKHKYNPKKLFEQAIKGDDLNHDLMMTQSDCMRLVTHRWLEEAELGRGTKENIQGRHNALEQLGKLYGLYRTINENHQYSHEEALEVLQRLDEEEYETDNTDLVEITECRPNSKTQ